VLPEEGSGIVKDLDDRYPNVLNSRGKPSKSRKLSRKQVLATSEFENRVREISKENDLGLTEDEITFITATGMKETRGGKSLQSRLESTVLPGRLSRSFGKFEQSPSFTRGYSGESEASPNSERDSILAIRNFYRENLGDFQGNPDMHKLYNLYNTGSKETQAKGLRKFVDYWKASENYRDGGEHSPTTFQKKEGMTDNDKRFLGDLERTIFSYKFGGKINYEHGGEHPPLDPPATASDSLRVYNNYLDLVNALESQGYKQHALSKAHTDRTVKENLESLQGQRVVRGDRPTKYEFVRKLDPYRYSVLDFITGAVNEDLPRQELDTRIEPSSAKSYDVRGVRSGNIYDATGAKKRSEDRRVIFDYASARPYNYDPKTRGLKADEMPEEATTTPPPPKPRRPRINFPERIPTLRDEVVSTSQGEGLVEVPRPFSDVEKMYRRWKRVDGKLVPVEESEYTGTMERADRRELLSRKNSPLQGTDTEIINYNEPWSRESRYYEHGGVHPPFAQEPLETKGNWFLDMGDDAREYDFSMSPVDVVTSKHTSMSPYGVNPTVEEQLAFMRDEVRGGDSYETHQYNKALAKGKDVESLTRGIMNKYGRYFFSAFSPFR
jgi:hypothetical protein